MYLFILAQVRHDSCFSQPMDVVGRCEISANEIGSICPEPVARFMTQFPEVVAATRVTSRRDQTFSLPGEPGGVRFALNTMYGDTSLLQVLPFKMMSGGGNDALADATKGMITRSSALKLFGTTDVIGKQIELNNTYPITITGVLEDIPDNSLYNPDVILPMKLMATMNGDPEDKADKWYKWISECYFCISPTADMAALNAKFGPAILERMSEVLGGLGNGETLEEMIEKMGGPNNPKMPHVRPFNDCYFAPEVQGAMNFYNPSSLMVLGIIAVLILAIAVINYVNIYTARSTEVIRSMGIKSIMGARRCNLIGFIIGDSVLITFVSVVTAFFWPTCCVHSIR